MTNRRAKPRRSTSGLRLLSGLVLAMVVIPSPALARGEAEPSRPARVVASPPVDLPPSVSLSLPSQPLLGSDVSFSVTFDNNDPADVGYGPVLDVILDATGADGNDGLGTTSISASYAGLPFTTGGANPTMWILTFDALGQATHPLFRDSLGVYEIVNGTPGDTLVVLRLPFGSFAPDQPPATVSLTVNMSNFADVGVPLSVEARGGYEFGFTPLDDWCCGDAASPDAIGDPTTGSVTPTLLTLAKTYSGPEDETATGPNFPRQYTVSVGIAPGQSVTSLVVSDLLPNNMQFDGPAIPLPGSGVCVPAGPGPGGAVTCSWPAAVSNSASLTFPFHIPLEDAAGGRVITAATGDDVTSCNQASASANWMPLDPADQAGGPFPVSANPGGCEHTLADKSIAIQKGVTNLSGGSASAGDTLEYALSFQISDFFAFDGIEISDVVSDGQHVVGGFIPTLEVAGNTFNLGVAAMTGANYDVACNYTGGPGAECTADDPAGNDGTTRLTFRISDELVSRGQPDPGRLIGGCVDPAGGTVDPDCGVYDDGPTTAALRFRTLIQDDFTDSHLIPPNSGDSSVDQGDVLDNGVTVTGFVLNTDTLAQTGSNESDTSGVGLQIGYGSLDKTVYAINGTICPDIDVCPGGGPYPIKPGDTVTYRLTYELPTSDVENLEFNDYLPLPVFHVDDPDEDGSGGHDWNASFDDTVSAAAPPAGVAKFGATDSFYAYTCSSGGTGLPPGCLPPTLTSDVTNNRLRFYYGDFSDTRHQGTTVELLFTVTVSDDPFADQLFLTNQAASTEGSTNAGTISSEEIVQIVLTEPVLRTTKGVIWTSNVNAEFDPNPPGPVAFEDPLSLPPRWSGVINSTDLGALPIDSDVSGVDAGDIVSFAIVIENTGSSLNGAFDIVLRDDLPGQYQIPGGGPNLQVYYGNGTGPISYVGLGGGPDGANGTPDDLFGSGIQLVDPVGAGVCSAHNPNLGNNIILITYDLQLRDNLTPGDVVNTSSLVGYAGSEGGPNHLATPQTDTATVATARPVVNKTITGTNQPHTLGNNVAIGEQVTYQLVVTIPEGVMDPAAIVDTLDPGLAFVSLDSLTASPGLSTSVAGGFAQVLTNARAALAVPGNVATYALGRLTNANRVDTTPETITVTYTAVVLNSAGNDRGVGRNNNAVITWTGGSAAGAAPNVVIVEPTLQVGKVALPTTGDAGDLIAFSLTFSHTAASDADAFNVTLSDTVPAGMTFVGGSLDCTSGVQDPDSYSFAGGLITATWASFLDNGTPSICTFQVTLDDTVEPGQVITNIANLAWTSLPGDVTAPQSPHNPVSTERTGDIANPGGAENDYRASGQAPVTILQVPDKSLVATSESHTGNPGGGERVAIGEIVRYHLSFQLAEGIATNLRLQDELPLGMQFLNDGTAKVAFVSNQLGITSTTILPSPPDCGGLNISGSSGGVTPTCPLPDDAVSSDDASNNDTYGSGTDVYFKLGTLDNRDRDADGEFVVVEFNALVENVAGNVAGQVLNNDFIPLVGASAFPASNTLAVTVALPNITLTKVVTTAPSDAGDTLVYTLTATNASGVNVAAAFDLSIADSIDARLEIQSVSGSTTGGACGVTPSTFVGGFVGQQVTATATCLNPGATMTVVITARVVNDVQAGSTIPNIADLAYTTLPGPNGTSPNPTGSTTPGGSGSPIGERGLAGQANASHTLALPGVSKQAPVPPQQTIGGEADYDLLVTLPEGATANLRVRDALPAGLGYVSHSVITTAAGSGGLLAADYNGALSTTPACPACVVGASGVTLEFQFGDVQTNGSGPANGSSANQFLVRVRARVLNVAGNQNGSTLTNTASLAYVNPQTGDTTVADGSRTLTVTEPELQLAKTANDDTPTLGQTLTYTLTVSHRPGSTADARDVVVTDTIPAGLTYVPASATVPVGWTVDASGAPTLVFSGSLTQAAGSVSFTYQATLGIPPVVVVGQTLTNTASGTWTSLPGPSPVERTGTGIGPNDYATSASETITASEIDLTLTKDDGGITAAPGQTYSYTLTIGNIGNVAATGVTVTDTVPQYTAFTPAGSTPGWSCLPDNSSGSTCTILVGDLAAGGSVAVTFRVTVVSSLPVMVIETDNTARVDGVNEPVLLQGNNTDSETTPLVAAPDLTITKDDGLDIVSPGSLLVYAINYANVGDQDATGVVVTETVPTATTFVAASSLPTVWSCPDGSIGGTLCRVTIGDLAAGAGGTLSFAVRIADPVPLGTTQIVDTIRIADDGTNGPEPTPGNNTDTDTDNLVTLPNADLTKSMVDSNQAHTLDPAVAIGEIVTYELVLTIPQGTMTAARLTDVLDLGLAFVDCEIPQVTGSLTTSLAGGFAAICSPPANPTVAAEPPGGPADQGRRITFDLGTLSNPAATNATLTLTYTAVVIDNPENLRGVNLNNDVTWDWVGGRLIERASDVTVVEPTLTLAKDADPRAVPPGGVVTFTLTINHPAPPSDSPAFDLVLTDTVPAEMAYVPGSLTASGGGIVDVSAAPLLRVTWPVLDLNDGLSASFQATMGNLPAGTQVRNDAYLSWSTLPGPVPGPLSSYNPFSRERVYDPPINANITVTIPALPGTGFAPGRVTELPPRPAAQPYVDLGNLALEIPSLAVRVPIVGVPAGAQAWDLTWLWDQAGHLEGTAYPTWNGNSALTAHVYRPDGRPGPFVRLSELKWDDRVIVHANGQRYEYRVRQVERVTPGDLSVLRHERQPWLTLLTCQGYDESQDKYLWRLAVRAVLVEVGDGPR